MRIGEFGDQPEIEVTFDVPDLELGGTKPVVLRVNRGVTGIVNSTRHYQPDGMRGLRVECIIDRWEGDTPTTRTEIKQL